MHSLWQRANDLGMLRAVFVQDTSWYSFTQCLGMYGEGYTGQGINPSGTGCCGMHAKGWMQTCGCIGRKLTIQASRS